MDFLGNRVPRVHVLRCLESARVTTYKDFLTAGTNFWRKSLSVFMEKKFMEKKFIKFMEKKLSVMK